MIFDCLYLFQKFCVDDVPLSSIKQERLEEGESCGGAMQKVPSLSDLSDPESSLGKCLYTCMLANAEGLGESLMRKSSLSY